MRHWCKFFCRFGVSALFFGAVAGTAHTQPKVGDRIGDWVFGCRALSASETICALNQTIVQTNTKKQIMRLSLQKLGKDEKLALVVSVPLGVYLATGIGGKIDEGEQFNLVWQSCTQGGCQAALALSDPQIAAMKAGNRLLIGFKARPDAKPITVAASLKGVTAGLAALGVQK